MTSSAQLEREAKQTRSQLAQTLDELRERITPGQLVDQAVDYAKDSGGRLFVRNLGRQTTANPLPVALIGAGIAWLMLSNGRRSGADANTTSINRAAETAIDKARQSMTDAGARIGEFSQQAGSQAQEFGQEASNRVSDWTADASARVTDARQRFRGMADSARKTAEQSAQQATSTASQAASSLSDTASSAYETTKARAADAYGAAADRRKQAASQMSNTIAGIGQRTAGATSDFLKFCKNQPLVLAGIGMALGAIVGALIPATEAEDQLMGETRDQLKDQAREAAENQYEKAKGVVEDGLKQAEAEFNFQTSTGSDHAEASLVPGAEHSGSKEPAE
jgi:ElaB/YqjD/DUF883 family membrane-anchored ribosome-binding protein